MIHSIMSYVHSSVQLLGPTTPSFQTWIHNPQISNQIDDAGITCFDRLILHILNPKSENNSLLSGQEGQIQHFWMSAI